jgi:multidrug transporter EmrE-like cation transporter
MTLFLAFSSALFYIVATYVMKQWSSLGSLTAVTLIIVTLGAAAICEILALRQERLGHIYVLILGIECVLVMVCTWYLLRESYAAHELLGLILIVAGIALVQLPSGTRAEGEARNVGLVQTDELRLPVTRPHVRATGTIPSGAHPQGRGGAPAYWPVTGIAV